MILTEIEQLYPTCLCNQSRTGHQTTEIAKSLGLPVCHLGTDGCVWWPRDECCHPFGGYAENPQNQQLAPEDRPFPKGMRDPFSTPMIGGRRHDMWGIGETFKNDHLDIHQNSSDTLGNTTNLETYLDIHARARCDSLSRKPRCPQKDHTEEVPLPIHIAESWTAE